MRAAAYTLDSFVEQMSWVDSLRKQDLAWGDSVFVVTRNSTYAISQAEDGTYWVSGGWFDRRHLSPVRMAINGCTGGGTAIKHDILAAPGLFLEFGNGVLTTRIQEVRIIHSDDQLTN
jgi:hypothetical protein